MSLNRYARRRDANERTIIDTLRAHGAVVYQLDSPADLLVGYRQKWFLLEVKDGAKPPSARALTMAEAQVELACRIDRLPYAVISSAAEALQAIGAT